MLENQLPTVFYNATEKPTKTYKDKKLDNQRAPATPGSRSASFALVVAQETLGNRNTPALFDRSPSSTFGSENRRTTLIASPTMYTLNMTPPAYK